LVIPLEHVVDANEGFVSLTRILVVVDFEFAANGVDVQEVFAAAGYSDGAGRSVERPSRGSLFCKIVFFDIPKCLAISSIVTLRTPYLKNSSSIQAALQLVQGNIEQRFFLCTDDEEIRKQFASYKNILINQSTKFVDKHWSGDWRSTGTDEIGRPTSFNVKRSKENIVDALIEALVLSRTTILNTSNSTFLRFARMLSSFSLERS